MFSTEKILIYIISLFFIFINEPPIIAKVSLTFILIWGLFIFIKGNFDKIEKDEKILFTAFILYFISYIPSFIVEQNFSLRVVDHPSRFVLFLPFAFAVRNFKSYEKFKIIFIIAVYVSSISVLINFYFNDFVRGFRYNSCISGAQHLLIMGNFLLFLFMTKNEIKYKYFYIFGYILSIVAVTCSETRGVIICIPILFIFTLIISSNFKKSYLFLYTPIIVFCLFLVITFTPRLKYKAQLTLNRMDSIFEKYKSNSISFDNSLEHRASFLFFGFKAIKFNPLWGAGRIGFSDSMVAVGYPTDHLDELTHSHNQYMSDLVMRGFFGFLSTAFFMYFLMNTFVKIRKNKENIFSSLGIIFLFSYLLFFLTDSPFIGSMHSLRFFILMYFILFYASKNYEFRIQNSS